MLHDESPTGSSEASHPKSELADEVFSYAIKSGRPCLRALIVRLSCSDKCRHESPSRIRRLRMEKSAEAGEVWSVEPPREEGNARIQPVGRFFHCSNDSQTEPRECVRNSSRTEAAAE